MKKMLKKVFSYVMVLSLIVVSLVAGLPQKVSAEEEVGKIGFSISTLNNPFFVSMADSAKATAEELGVEISVVDAGNDTAKQVTDIEDLVSTGIKVLIVNPEDSASVAPAVEEAMAAGVKVIAVDREVEGVEVDSYIGTDNVVAGEKVGEYLLELISQDDEVAILEGIPGASSAMLRQEGFNNALEGNVNIVTSQTANYDRTEGMTVAENIMQAHPNLKVFVAANDEMALGAIEAIQGLGKTPGEDVYVTGFDAGEDAKKAVEEGNMLITVEQGTEEMGKLAVEIALKMMNGEDYDAEYPIDVVLLDKEELAK